MPDSSAQGKFEQREINDKLEKFFKERKLELENSNMLKDFSDLIADSSNNPDIKSIAPYVDTMENLLNSILKPYHKKEFLDYVTNIVPNHKHENWLNGVNNGLKEEMLINNLKELSSDHSDVMLNLKPSNNEKEFEKN